VTGTSRTVDLDTVIYNSYPTSQHELLLQNPLTQAIERCTLNDYLLWIQVNQPPPPAPATTTNLSGASDADIVLEALSRGFIIQKNSK
jgi:hypothetical protein